jgi:hypothetical protein
MMTGRYRVPFSSCWCLLGGASVAFLGNKCVYQLLITVSTYVVFDLTIAVATVAFKRCVRRGHELLILYRQFSSRQFAGRT